MADRDTMMFGIATMPYEMAMRDELSRYQFYTNTQRLVAALAALQAENERLREEVERLHEQLRLVAADQVNAEAEANDAHAENKRMAKEVTNEWNQSVGPWSGASR